MDKKLEEGLNECKSLSGLARFIFGKENYTNREKIKKMLEEVGIDWEIWVEEKNKKPVRYCLNCGNVLTGDTRSKFCNHSCAASYNNKGVVRNGKKREKEENCLYCGKKLEKNQIRFCCATCNTEYNYEKNVKKWKDGIHQGCRKDGSISPFVRRYMLEKFNYCCEICGFNEVNPYTNSSVLQIHHIDGNCMNNEEENLQVLCPNHHALTDTFGALNKGNSKRLDRHKN